MCVCVRFNGAYTGNDRSTAVGVVRLPLCRVGRHGCRVVMPVLVSIQVMWAQYMSSCVLAIGLVVWLPPRVRDAPGSIPVGVGHPAENFV